VEENERRWNERMNEGVAKRPDLNELDVPKWAELRDIG
jgi:hypothetical protein